jgi:ABC-type multidrug transport system fused ATPase/permease subunit
MTLLNFILTLIPAHFQDLQWQLSITTQLIDQGIMPLIGIVFLVVAFWVEHISRPSELSRPPVPMGKSLIFGLASLMGLIFLLLVPLHFSNVRLVNEKAIANINRQAAQAQAQLPNKIADAVQKERGRIETLLNDPQQLRDAIKSGEVPQANVALLEQFRSNPKALEAFLKQETENLQAQLKKQLDSQKQAETQKLGETWKVGWRACTSGLLLAIGYSVVGWTGLRRLQKGDD